MAAIDGKLFYWLHESVLDFVKTKLNSPGEINFQLPTIRRSNQAFAATTPQVPFAILDFLDTRIIGSPEDAASVECLAQVSIFDEKSIKSGKNAFDIDHWESRLAIACKTTVSWPVKKWSDGEAIIGYFIAIHQSTNNLADPNLVGRGLTIKVIFNYE